MWKKSAPKKLSLKKETLRELSSTDLRGVQGGGTRECEGIGESSHKVNGVFYPCNQY